MTCWKNWGRNEVFLKKTFFNSDNRNHGKRWVWSMYYERNIYFIVHFIFQKNLFRKNLYFSFAHRYFSKYKYPNCLCRITISTTFTLCVSHLHKQVQQKLYSIKVKSIRSLINEWILFKMYLSVCFICVLSY